MSIMIKHLFYISIYNLEVLIIFLVFGAFNKTTTQRRYALIKTPPDLNGDWHVEGVVSRGGGYKGGLKRGAGGLKGNSRERLLGEVREAKVGRGVGG